MINNCNPVTPFLLDLDTDWSSFALSSSAFVDARTKDAPENTCEPKGTVHPSIAVRETHEPPPGQPCGLPQSPHFKEPPCWVVRRLDQACLLASSTLGAFACAQLPKLADVYNNVLGGWLLANKEEMKSNEANAAKEGVTLNELLIRWEHNPDPSVVRKSLEIRDNMMRFKFLNPAPEAYLQAHPLLRPFVTVRYMDSSIAHKAWQAYTPGMNFDTSTVCYGLVGVVVGIGAYYALSRAFRSLVRRTAVLAKRMLGAVKMINQTVERS